MSDQIQDLQLEHYKYVTELGDWKRTHSCSELTLADNGREVCLMGWVQFRRDHGGLIFVDLRDRDGYTQIVVDPDCVSEEDFHAAEHLGREYVLKVSGRVRERAPEAVNPNMVTGTIEVGKAISEDKDNWTPYNTTVFTKDGVVSNILRIWVP